MTSKSLFSKMIRNDIKRRIWLLAILLLVYIIFGPVSLMIAVENAKSYQNSQDFYILIENFFKMDFLDVPIIFFSAIALGLSGFSYVFSKKKIDLYHSLPVKREKMFIVQYTSGSIMYVAVLLFKYIANTIIALLGGHLNNAIFTNAISSFLGELIHFFLIYNVMILTVSITGTMLAAVLGFIAANLVYPLYSFCIGFISEYCYATRAVTTTSVEKIPYFSPIATIITYIEKQNNVVIESGVLLKHNIWVLIIALLCLVIAYYLYKIRRSEAATKTIAFEKFKPFIRIPIVILGGILGGTFVVVNTNKFMASWVWIGIIVGVVATHAICEAIFSSDYKSAFKSWKQLILSLVVAIGIVVIMFTDILGYDKYIPKRDKIEAATVMLPIDYDISYNDIVIDPASGKVDTYYVDREEYMYKRAFTDQEIIDIVCEFGKLGVKNVDNMKEIRKTENTVYEEGVSSGEAMVLSKDELTILDNEKSDFDTLDYKVYYRLSSGREVVRNYSADRKDVLQLIKKIYEKTEYKKTHYDLFELNKQKIFTSVEVYDAFSERQVQLSGEDADELLSVYLDDLENSDFEDICEIPIATISPRYTTMWNYQESLVGYYIYPSFSKTLEYIRSIGADMDNMVSIPDASKVECINIGAYDYVYNKETNQPIYVYGLSYTKEDPKGQAMIDMICNNVKLYGLTWSNSELHKAENRVEVTINYKAVAGIQQSQTAYFDIGKVPDELKTDILDYVVENP